VPPDAVVRKLTLLFTIAEEGVGTIVQAKVEGLVVGNTVTAKLHWVITPKLSTTETVSTTTLLVEPVFVYVRERTVWLEKPIAVDKIV
jgi:hypothetical protein